MTLNQEISFRQVQWLTGILCRWSQFPGGLNVNGEVDFSACSLIDSIFFQPCKNTILRIEIQACCQLCRYCRYCHNKRAGWSVVKVCQRSIWVVYVLCKWYYITLLIYYSYTTPIQQDHCFCPFFTANCDNPDNCDNIDSKLCLGLLAAYVCHAK